ncbi:8791_t:CDS:2, partial [Gigaspora rosea]
IASAAEVIQWKESSQVDDCYHVLFEQNSEGESSLPTTLTSFYKQYLKNESASNMLIDQKKEQLTNKKYFPEFSEKPREAFQIPKNSSKPNLTANSQDALTDQNKQQQIEPHILKFQQAFIILGRRYKNIMEFPEKPKEVLHNT